MKRGLSWLAAAAVIVLLVVTLSLRLLDRPRLGGSVIEPPEPAPEINLARAGGGSFRLSDLRGDIVLLFFGYTNCPDVCPTTLADMKVVFDRLDRAGEDVRFVFITVDADRDDPAAIRSYLDAFNPAFIGLTGSDEALEKVYADYTVNVSRAPAAGVAGYEVEHISRIFVVDRQGNLVETFPYGLSRETIIADLLYLVSAGGAAE